LNGFVGLLDYGVNQKKFDGSMKYPAGCNMTYRTAVLKKAGGFNTRLTFRSDDKDIFHRVTALSGEVYYVPAATVYHNIDAQRLQFKTFKTLFLKTGNEEKIRVHSSKIMGRGSVKFIELLAKTAVAGLLYCVFFLKGQEIKGRYLFYSQWFTLQGFLQKDVFVR